ncbi:hypothetical protein N7461_008248 [Penicillium sp. DV-2018c]|nr:hypothetical protein N7461_008248 [Penicillium sp. DV-2018c]
MPRAMMSSYKADTSRQAPEATMDDINLRSELSRRRSPPGRPTPPRRRAVSSIATLPPAVALSMVTTSSSTITTTSSTITTPSPAVTTLSMGTTSSSTITTSSPVIVSSSTITTTSPVVGISMVTTPSSTITTPSPAVTLLVGTTSPSIILSSSTITTPSPAVTTLSMGTTSSSTITTSSPVIVSSSTITTASPAVALSTVTTPSSTITTPSSTITTAPPVVGISMVTTPSSTITTPSPAVTLLVGTTSPSIILSSSTITTASPAVALSTVTTPSSTITTAPPAVAISMVTTPSSTITTPSSTITTAPPAVAISMTTVSPFLIELSPAFAESKIASIPPSIDPSTAISPSTAIPSSTAISPSTAIPPSTAISPSTTIVPTSASICQSSITTLSSIVAFSSVADSATFNGNPPSVPQAESGTAASGQSELSIEAEIARMPCEKRPKALKFGPYWVNGGEALVHVFIGPDRRHVGPFRLCAIPQRVRQDLVATKNPKSKFIEIWFKHLCTVREYENLCESSAENTVLSTGWVEGFPDTNRDLYHFSQDLQKDDLIAIHYPVHRKKRHSDTVWVAWSRWSQESNFHYPALEVPPGVPLLVAARSMLAPIESLARNGHSQPSGRPQALLPDTSISLRTDLPRGDGLEPSSSSRRSTFHDMGLSPQDPSELFLKSIKVDIDELAKVEEAGKISKAGIFYLHFPSDDIESQESLDFWLMHLTSRGIIVLSSRDHGDWGKFVENSKQGVAIFDESFTEYDTLDPPLRKVLYGHSFNFWVVRLQRPLELIDPRYYSPDDHHLRIFPHGGVVLLTEDMFKDLKGVAVALEWLRQTNKRKSWCLMLPPGILEWIEKRLADETRSQDHGLLLLIQTLIIKNNASDTRTALFDKASLDLNAMNSILSPPSGDYGTRTSSHSPNIADKVERDADHLVEFLAGWSLLNIPRFRAFFAVTTIKPPGGKRWDKWGHLTIMRGGFTAFYKTFKIDPAGIMAQLSGDSKAKTSPTTTSQVSTLVATSAPPSRPIR